MCIWGEPKVHNFSPFPVKFIHMYDFGGDEGEAPPCLRKFFVFGGLNLHNFRPFFSLTFYTDIGFFGGLKDTPAPPLKILRGSAPRDPVPKPV